MTAVMAAMDGYGRCLFTGDCFFLVFMSWYLKRLSIFLLPSHFCALARYKNYVNVRSCCLLDVVIQGDFGKSFTLLFPLTEAVSV